MSEDKPDFLPEEIRSHLISLHHEFINIVCDEHVSDCRCKLCLIRNYNAQLIRESNPMTNFKELKLVSTINEKEE